MTSIFPSGIMIDCGIFTDSVVFPVGTQSKNSKDPIEVCTFAGVEILSGMGVVIFISDD